MKVFTLNTNLYNQLHGVCPDAPILLKILHLDEKPECIGRFRDIYLNEDGTKIILLTRNGGGNREQYQYVFDDFKKLHPCFIRDWDDEFDSTYAYAEFSVPTDAQEDIKKMATGKKPLTVKEKFDQTLKEMEDMTPEQLENDKRFKPTADMLKEMMK